MPSDADSATSSLPQVVLKPRRALPFFSRHPWVFHGAIERIVGNPEAGAEVALLSHEGQFVARGLFNPHSQIRVRLYSWDEHTPLDEAFWSQRLDLALSLRRSLPGFGPTDACRLVFSEADGLSGLIMDRYADWLLVQFTSLAVAQRRELLLRLLQEKLQPAGIWLRTEKGIRESEGLDLIDGLVAGREPPRPLFIEEHGIRYGIDVAQGQKTGFFLDQRENRAAVADYVRGQRVLDLFCYTGGFGLHCAKHGGAAEVLSVDLSEPALVLARANAELNGVLDRMRFERSDGFKMLERLAAAGERFDTVILDPPKLARHRSGLNSALRGYYSLNRLALDVLRPGGLLVTCSCSGLVTREMFVEVLAKVAVNARRTIQVLDSRGQSSDHPTSVHCPETEYLKCLICRVT